MGQRAGGESRATSVWDGMFTGHLVPGKGSYAYQFSLTETVTRATI